MVYIILDLDLFSDYARTKHSEASKKSVNRQCH